MYVIVDIAGQQLKVEKDQEVYVNRLEGDEGSKVNFDQVLLIDKDGKVKVGSPVVKGASVTATILSHLKGDKVLVFKKKRRKGYQKLNGHRQYLSLIKIEDISEKGSAKKDTTAKAEKKVEEQPKADKPVAKKPVEKKTAVKKTAEVKEVEKKPVAKKPAAKKPAVKKPAAKKPAVKKVAEAKKDSAKPAKKATAKKAEPKKVKEKETGQKAEKKADKE